jgi:hypothetical protein
MNVDGTEIKSFFWMEGVYITVGTVQNISYLS